MVMMIDNHEQGTDHDSQQNQKTDGFESRGWVGLHS